MNSNGTPNEPGQESPFAGTVDVSASEIGQARLTPAPFRIARDVADNLVKRAFQGHDPAQETVTIRHKEESQDGQETQLNAHAFALWYREFPISPREVMKQYALLERHMGYALAGLNEAIPAEIQKMHQYIAAQMQEYQAAQMKLMRSSSPDINQLQDNFFTDTFTTTCAKLLNDMKALGEKFYLRLNEQVVREKRQAFQATSGAQEVREQYPFLSDRFETSLNPLDQAQKAFEKEVKDGIEVDCHQAFTKLPDREHLQQQYPQKAVQRYIQVKTVAAIQQVIEASQLTDEAKIQLYQRLPKAVHSFSSHSNEEETAAYFKLDRVIERDPETEHVLKAIIAALIRGLALTYAAFGDEKNNEDILWAYSYALQHGHINYMHSKNSQFNGPTANMVYVQYPKTGKWLTKETFFQPMEHFDDNFVPDYMALAMKNNKLEMVVRQIRDGFSSQQSTKNTAIAQGGAFELFQRSMANHEMLKAFSAQEHTPEGVTHVDQLDDAVEKLNNLRLDAAMAIHELLQKIASLEEEQSRQQKNFDNQAYLLDQARARGDEQIQRAKTAEESLDNTQETIVAFSNDVMSKCSEISEHADRIVGGKAQIKELSTQLYQHAQELKSKK